MSLAYSQRIAGPFVAAGGQTVFGIGFPILAAADVRVRRLRDGVITTLALGTEYLLTGVGGPSAQIVLTVGAEANDKYVVLGVRPPVRTSQLVDNGPIPAGALNAEFDHLQAQLQELRRDIDAALARSPFDGSGGSNALPAGKTGVVILDDQGNLQIVPATGLGGSGGPALSLPLKVDQGGTGGDTPAEARGNLGLGALATKSQAATGDIADGAVTTPKLADGAVTAVKAAAGLVTYIVEDALLTAPPASPADGRLWLVAPGGSGAWLGQDGKLAVRAAGAWTFLAPAYGWRALSLAQRRLYTHSGFEWVSALVEQTLAGRLATALPAGRFGGGLTRSAVLDGKRVVVWGDGANAKNAQANGLDAPLPLEIPFETPPAAIVKLVAGNGRFWALDGDGWVHSAGDGAGYALGHGDQVNRLRFKRIAAFYDANVRMRDIVAARHHSTDNPFVAFVTTTDTVWTAGYNDGHGMRGDGTTVAATLPSQVILTAGGPLTNVDTVSVGGVPHTIAARLKDGRLARWGANATGQLGDGTTTSASRAAIHPTLTNVVQAVAASGSNGSTNNGLIIVRLADGTLLGAGRNSSGELAQGADLADKSAFVTISHAETFKTIEIGCGSNATVAGITATDKLVCWGRNTHGQLGNGGTAHTGTIVQPAGAFQGAVTRIAIGGAGTTDAQTLYVGTASGIWAAGYNASHNCADGSGTANATAFAPVVGLDAAAVLAEWAPVGATAAYGLIVRYGDGRLATAGACSQGELGWQLGPAYANAPILRDVVLPGQRGAPGQDGNALSALLVAQVTADKNTAAAAATAAAGSATAAAASATTASAAATTATGAATSAAGSASAASGSAGTATGAAATSTTNAATAIAAAADAVAAAAAMASVIGAKLFGTKADADTNIGTVAADAHVVVVTDETHSGQGTIYQKVSGVYVFRRTIVGETPGIWMAEWHGVSAGNTAGANDTAIAALLALVYASGGGQIQFGNGTIQFATNWLLPNDGGTPRPKQVSLILAGCGAHYDGSWALAAPTGGTILQFNSTAGLAHIDTRGTGLLAFRDLTLRVGANSGLPIVHTTNTTIHTDKVCVWGYNAGTAANNDAFVLGGTDTTISGDFNAPFQGYGSHIDRVFAVRIRRVVLGQTYCNSNVISNITTTTSCGSSDTDSAPIEINGHASNSSGGNITRDCTLELPGYKHAVKLGINAQFNIIQNVNAYDNAALDSVVHCVDASTNYNMIYAGYLGAPGKPYLTQHASSTNYLIPTSPDHRGILPPTLFRAIGSHETEFEGNTVFSAGNGGVRVQPKTAQGGSGLLFPVRRSAAEATDPGANVLEVLNNGAINVGSANTNGGGNVTNNVPSGAGWSSNGKIWRANGTGGAMQQDSGTGGSNFTAKNAGFIMQTNAGTEYARFDSSAARFPTIGTTASAANAYLDNAASPANSLLRSTSSLRYKTDVEPLDAKRAADNVRALAAAAIWYRSKAPADNPAWSWYGLGAEDVARIDPRLAHYAYADEDREAYEVEQVVGLEDVTFRNSDGTVVEGVQPVIERVTQYRVKAGAQLRPDGVQYERLPVLMLPVLVDLLERVEQLEAALAARGP